MHGCLQYFVVYLGFRAQLLLWSLGVHNIGAVGNNKRSVFIDVDQEARDLILPDCTLKLTLKLYTKTQNILPWY